MTITYILLLPRKKGMTKAQFRQHYETSHVAMAKKYFGHLFVDYRRHYPDESFGDAAVGNLGSNSDAEFDAITKVDFKDRAAFDEFRRICARPEVKEALGADEERFLDREHVRVSVCEEVRTWTSADLVTQ